MLLIPINTDITAVYGNWTYLYGQQLKILGDLYTQGAFVEVLRPQGGSIFFTNVGGADPIFVSTNRSAQDVGSLRYIEGGLFEADYLLYTMPDGTKEAYSTTGLRAICLVLAILVVVLNILFPKCWDRQKGVLPSGIP